MRIIKNSGKMKIISMLKLKKWSLEGAKLMAVFSIDLPGRVKNFELPRTKPLMPLFETIVNSIYAIEERQQNDDKVNGYINIEIIREPQMRVQTEGIDSSINDITGFVVTDNGIGFDENNMKSFLQSDSTYRAEKGGKGVGRFAWLKAFKEADIESSFIDAGEWVRRKFCFTLEQNEINDSLEDIDPLTDNKTMRRTSDEIEYQAHNLWLIDERLAYCEYVSSDIPFDNNPREDRTDVMILDKPVAVSDEPNTGREYETIVILELKKPMRNDYTQAENPIIQMLGYVDKISSNEMKDKNGRLIKTGTNTQFYLYAVCDITSKLRKIAEDFDFIETPDKRGMYKYHDKKRAYIEILSFDKIIDDAGKRNRILFEKLGI